MRVSNVNVRQTQTTGEVIERLRSESKPPMPVWWLAKELEMTTDTLLRIRKGERELKVTEAQRLAEVFGVPVETFLGERE